ncbi:helix-turn-helix transcriptional regulator [Anoxybacillus rupiensis]|uniref:Helix-turn-helix transcriptional regulator n=1 Tax=Anoxybacteroides rupiense TaxID=311460 RepID=A0ABD5IQW0_9BACL|nr:helix-turn-helix transcriptional regulator [Anoxybacillus rupiensis]
MIFGKELKETRRNHTLVMIMKSKIDEIIKLKGYKKKYVAEKIGVSANQLSNWITGKNYPTLDKAFKLAELLGVSVEDLYEKNEGQP